MSTRPQTVASPIAPPLLSARGLRLQRGGWQLDVPELGVRAGSTLAIVGPNGAGKSTLLHLLALLERPTAGAVLLDGAMVTPGDRRARQRMAVTLQQPLLVDGSVQRNVELGPRLHGMTGAERRQRAQRWLERTGIAHLAGRRARSLSGGEQRRVSLARALALEPELLFLDEPFAALDAPSHRALLAELPGWLRAAGCTTVLVTHDRDDALHLADDVAVLVQGRLHQCGAVDWVFGHPATPEVAALFGIDNLLFGTLRSEASGVWEVESGSVLLYVAAAPSPGNEAVTASGTVQAGRPVLVALHPEQITVFAAGSAPLSSARNQLPARVTEVEPAGARLRLHLDAGVPLIAEITRASAADLSIAAGTEVIAAFKATAAHLIAR